MLDACGLGLADICEDSSDRLFLRGGNSYVEASGTNGLDQAVEIAAQQYHSAVFYVLLHCSPEASLSLLRELVCLVYNQNLERFPALGLYICVASYFLDNILDNVPIVVVVV